MELEINTENSSCMAVRRQLQLNIILLFFFSTKKQFACLAYNQFFSTIDIYHELEFFSQVYISMLEESLLECVEHFKLMLCCTMRVDFSFKLKFFGHFFMLSQ